ncbi:MAG: hypothetical protein MUF51_03315 [Vicinamibacteria bacterium]|nr:hypothetical protein [Vicinamibacteria bacterium]
MDELLPRDLFLAPDLSETRVAAFLRRRGFEEPAAADRNLQDLAADPRIRLVLADLSDALFASLAETIDCDRALAQLDHVARAAVNPLELWHYLRDSPAALDRLTMILAASPFMAEILIRHPGLVYWCADPEVILRARTRADLDTALDESLASLTQEARRRDALRLFKRQELLHIGVRDILFIASVAETLAAVSLLARVIVERALAFSWRACLLAAGDASSAREELLSPRGFAVVAMGKLGGDELNFSSDIDLIFVYDAETLATLPLRKVSPDEFATRLAQHLTAALCESNREGHAYRVDLRLRPEGKQGRMAAPCDSLRAYYTTRAATWERLALIRAQPIAGDEALGARIRLLFDELAFCPPFERATLDDIRAIKERIDQRVLAQSTHGLDIKLGPGGIREIEMIVQTLQLAHGRRQPALRARNTLSAVDALVDHEKLSEDEARILRAAYLFLRDLENKLQMSADAQVHILPDDIPTLSHYALRMARARRLSPQDRARDFRVEISAHMRRVHEVFSRLFTTPPDSLFAS